MRSSVQKCDRDFGRSPALKQFQTPSISLISNEAGTGAYRSISLINGLHDGTGARPSPLSMMDHLTATLTPTLHTSQPTRSKACVMSAGCCTSSIRF